MDIFGTPPRTDNLSDLGLKESKVHWNLSPSALTEITVQKVWVVSQAQCISLTLVLTGRSLRIDSL